MDKHVARIKGKIVIITLALVYIWYLMFALPLHAWWITLFPTIEEIE